MSEELKILLVEDDSDARANLCDILELDGHHVLPVATAHEARRSAESSQACVVILDRKLPDGTAEGLIPELRELIPSADIVVVTGYADLDSTIAAFRQGVADYLIKPVNPDALRNCIEKIASRRRIEQELREEQQFADLILRTAEAVVLILDMEGKIVRFNPYFERVSGWKLEEVAGQDWFSKCLPERQRARIREVFMRTAANVNTSGTVNPIVTRDGTERQIRWSNTTLRDDVGEPNAVLAVGVDITDLLTAQEHALQSERLAAIGQTVTALAHESRNVLQRIQASVDMIELEIDKESDAFEDLRKIHRATGDLHELLEEVREFAAPIKLHLETTNLADLWQRVWKQLESEHRERDASIHVTSENLNLRVEVDVMRIEQIFRNLFENSLAACSDPVEINIGCSHADAATLVVTISDNGPGLNNEQTQHVFKPFFTTKSKGTGLGMSISQRLINAHGGSIRAVECERGATFEILIPRSPANRC